MESVFQGRELCIATKHSKEQVIAPLMEAEFGIQSHVLTDLDTDILGTFSGEIERSMSPLETARQKCLMALQNSPFDLVIASEGSFGPHPSMPFVASDEEIVFLYDKLHQLEIWEVCVSAKTNFKVTEIQSYKELEDFAAEIGFPSHGIILRSLTDKNQTCKGIVTAEELKQAYHELNEKGQGVRAETDMRAMHNPTRMKVIAEATVQLIQRMKSLCPSCHTPGFGFREAIRGLPCEICNFPTRLVKSEILACGKCGYEKENFFPNGTHQADATYCDICNP